MKNENIIKLIKMLSKIYDDYCIFLGKNQLENEALLNMTRDNQGPCKDYQGSIYWFHLAGHSSAHVILQSRDPPTRKMFKEAAVFLKENSKYRNERKLEIVFINRKYIKQTKIPGTVIMKNKGFTINI